MLNTTAPLFTGDKFSSTIKRQQAELYTRLFHLMAEDFPTNTDLKQYVTLLTEEITALQEQLRNLFQILSTHTHTVPAHTHSIPQHTHISGGPGSASSANIGGFITAATPLSTQSPVESNSIKWSSVRMPEVPNTTGVAQNLQGSSVIQGPSLEGPLVTSKRRLKVPEILNTTKTIPPILKPDLI